MDNRKIDEILARERPKHKKLEGYQDESLVGSDEARDVDVKNLPVSAWKKQPVQAAPRDTDYPAAKEKPMAPKKTGGSSIDELRERFRPRKRGQRGGDADSPARGARPPETGKIALRRLKMGPEGGDDDSSMDVLIDEDDGIIGESDSGPEGKIRKKKR